VCGSVEEPKPVKVDAIKMVGHKIMSDIQKLEREKRLKRREEMKVKSSPLQKKRNMPAKKGERPIDPQPASEGRPCQREVEVPIITEAPQMGEAVSEALPLALVQSNGIGNVQSVSSFLQSPVVQFILENEMHIRPGQVSIWSQINDWGIVERRIQIERPLQGNFVTIIPKFSNHFIIVTYPGIEEAPPCQVYQLLRTEDLRLIHLKSKSSCKKSE